MLTHATHRRLKKLFKEASLDIANTMPVDKRLPSHVAKFLTENQLKFLSPVLQLQSELSGKLQGLQGFSREQVKELANWITVRFRLFSFSFV